MHCVKDIILIIQEELKHNALIDCELLSKVYINLLDQKEPSFELNLEEDYNHEINSVSNIRIISRRL